MSKFKSKSLIGVLFAIGAGVMAFCTELDNQKKEKMIEDMEKRITKLERKEN